MDVRRSDVAKVLEAVISNATPTVDRAQQCDITAVESKTQLVTPDLPLSRVGHTRIHTRIHIHTNKSQLIKKSAQEKEENTEK